MQDTINNKKEELSIQDKEIIYNSIENILQKEFGLSNEKANIKYGIDHDRINFACPYCGDSTKSDKKKRGNLYWDSLGYHCFNCGKHTDAPSLLKDFDVDIEKESFLNFKSLTKNLKDKKNNVDKKGIYFEYLRNYGIPLDKLEKEYNLFNIEDSKNVYNWCKSRILTPFSVFLRADEKDDKIYILNIDLYSKRVISYQTRKLNKKIFNNYTLRNLRKDFNLQISDDMYDYINVSSFFNILNVDLRKKITLFESATDSFFLNNNLSISSITKNINRLESLDYRCFFDNDKAGKEKSLQMLDNGREVFMWRKFIKDFELYNYTKNIKDLNDIMGVCYTYKLNAHKYINSYFTNKKIQASYV